MHEKGRATIQVFTANVLVDVSEIVIFQACT